jgi:ATP-binding cassette subfamily C protein CydC
LLKPRQADRDMGNRKPALDPFVRVLRRHSGAMLVGTAAGCVAAAAAIGLLSLSGWFISAAAFAGLSPATAYLFNFFLPSIGVRVFAVLRTLARYAERVLTHESTFRILESLRVWFYERLEPLAPAGLWRFRSGDVLNRIVADIEALENLYLRTFSPSAIAGMVSAILFIVVSAFDARIAAVSWILLAAAGIGVSLASLRAGEPIGREIASRSAELRIRLVEGLQGMAEIKLFGAEAVYRSAVDASQAALTASQHRMAWINGAAAAAIHVLSGGAVVAALFLGAVLVSGGSVDGTKLAVIVLAVMVSFETIFALPAAYQYLGRTLEAGRRLLEIVGTPPPVTFRESTQPLPDRFDVTFDHVRFRYRKELSPALDDVTLTIPHGQRTAVVGESGAGKTTLANLLVRFFDPESGVIRIGGCDLRGFSEEDLRRAVAVLSQQSHLFSATIRQNLLIGKPAASEEELRRALAAARVLDFVDNLPEGLDTWVGEAGHLVSAGQARRLAVARAILRDAPIWVLDEPSEGLDRITEKKLQESLLDVTAGRTVLWITHRLANMGDMDEVVVIHQSRIADQGPHAELLVRNRNYAAWHARLV